MIGTVIRIDNATLNFDKLMYARVLMDMKINRSYLEEITFTDVNDDRIYMPVEYDWKPITCQNCN